MREHLGGIIAFLQTRIPNGTIEAIRGRIQLAQKDGQKLSKLPLPEHCRVPQSRKVAASSSGSTYGKRRRGI
nr:hypothetical protein [Methylacidimicrobium sp. B4]